jgi:hypothetical protein
VVDDVGPVVPVPMVVVVTGTTVVVVGAKVVVVGAKVVVVVPAWRRRSTRTPAIETRRGQ